MSLLIIFFGFTRWYFRFCLFRFVWKGYDWISSMSAYQVKRIWLPESQTTWNWFVVIVFVGAFATNHHHLELKVKRNAANTHACTLAIDILVHYYRKYGQVNRVHKTESNSSYGKVMSGVELFFSLVFGRWVRSGNGWKEGYVWMNGVSSCTITITNFCVPWMQMYSFAHWKCSTDFVYTIREGERKKSIFMCVRVLCVVCTTKKLHGFKFRCVLLSAAALFLCVCVCATTSIRWVALIEFSYK